MKSTLRYLFKDEVKARNKEREERWRRDERMLKACKLYYLSMISGSPEFDDLPDEEKERWIESAERFTGNIDDPQLLILRAD